MLHGLERVVFDGGYAQAASRVHTDDRRLVDEAMASCRAGESVRFRYRVARAGDGEWRWFDSYASPVSEGGDVVRMVGAVADITEQVSAEAEVIEANAFQHAVIAASPDFTFIVDVMTGAMVYGSRDKDVLGLSSEQTRALGPLAIDVLVHPDDQAKVRAHNALARDLEDGQVLHLRYRARHTDGGWRWLSRHVVPFKRDAAGTVVQVLGVLRDVTDVVRAEERLAHDALHDSLTGLPNRELLLARLHAALIRSQRDEREVAVLFCDLDGFKRVNDTAGHAAGDAVLMETANRLRDAVREEDTVARVGGDEFVIIVEPWNRLLSDGVAGNGAASGDRTLALRVADRVVSSLRAPIVVQGIDHEVTISIGITYSSLVERDDDGVPSASAMLEEADAAMYRAKFRGKDRVELFGVAPAGDIVLH